MSKFMATALSFKISWTFSIPDFRRTDKGNIRHGLGDIVMLMIFARMSKCVGRADIIEFGRYNLGKFQSMGLSAQWHAFRAYVMPGRERD